MFGAALATSISYFMCFLFCSVVFCVQKRIKTESKTFYITPIIRDYRTEFCDFFKTRRSE
jgi:Na+-driven multidrug efflux pump